jgi:hypothetical protein
MSTKRPTHTWLKPVLDDLNGLSQRPFGVATSLHGLYGQTGIAQLATGTAGITGVTGAGGMTAFSMAWFNGGSGAYYKIEDIVTALKNVGILKR